MTKPNRIFLLFPLFLFFLCLLFPSVCAKGVEKGLSLSVHSALPALFPSLVLSRMAVLLLGKSNGKTALLAVFFLGLFCGFPVGAMSASSLYQEGSITKKEAERLLFFSCQAGPSFLIGFCASRVFGDPGLGWLLFLLQAALATFFFFFFFCKKLFQKEEKNLRIFFSPPLSRIITSALSDAANSFLYIASCIVFFSFLGELIFYLVPLSAAPRSLVLLFLELTSGCKTLAFLPRKTALLFWAAGCGWNGLSVHLQSLSFLSRAGLSSKLYFFGKLAFMVFLPLGMLFLEKLLS
jgi:hypothetical protein